MQFLSFETDHFNRTEVRDYFINPCCFGDDVATWLMAQLEKRHVNVAKIYQEDWGWELDCEFGGSRYFLSIVLVAGDQDGDYGEWRIYVTKQCSLIGRIFGKDKMVREEAIIAVAHTILSEAQFGNIHCLAEV
ncbi:hypothetical protein JXA32_05705 [Candidatus Sumerlaeota bacterium]|nr:hypothetical protein [Candidatus Sumerlaeota bacterium]